MEPSASSYVDGVSVVVPVHNAMEHLEACLDSLRAQTLSPLEVLCIDDGSTDGSGDYLDSLCARDPLFHVIHQKQSGVSAARNRGLDAARGSHILFADSDDIADPQLVSIAYAAARTRGSHLTIFGFDEFYHQDGATIDRELCDVDEFYQRAFTLDDLNGLGIPAFKVVTPNVWRILFDRSFLVRNGIRFHEELATSEDLAFIYESLIASESLALVRDRLYHYRRSNLASLTRAPRGLAGFSALERVLAFAGSRGCDERYALHLVNIVADVACYAMSTAYDKREFLQLFEAYTERWKRFVDAHRHLVDPTLAASLAELDRGALDFLFSLYERTRVDLDSFRSFETYQRHRADVAEAEAQRLRAEVTDLRNSTSYRIGNGLVRIPARVKNMIQGGGE